MPEAMQGYCFSFSLVSPFPVSSLVRTSIRPAISYDEKKSLRFQNRRDFFEKILHDLCRHGRHLVGCALVALFIDDLDVVPALEPTGQMETVSHLAETNQIGVAPP